MLCSHRTFSSSLVMFLEKIKSQTRSLKLLCSDLETCREICFSSPILNIKSFIHAIPFRKQLQSQIYFTDSKDGKQIRQKKKCTAENMIHSFTTFQLINMAYNTTSCSPRFIQDRLFKIISSFPHFHLALFYRCSLSLLKYFLLSWISKDSVFWFHKEAISLSSCATATSDFSQVITAVITSCYLSNYQFCSH